MAFINTRIDDGVAYGFTGGPEWSTQVVMLDNGREVRNGQWLYPKHRYAAQYSNLVEARRAAVLEAFHACRGQLHAFRFKDWADYQATNEVIAPTVGTSDAVQLIKSYTFGGQSSTRLIQAPVTVTVTKDGSTTIAGTLDDETGLFTPAAPWASGTYAWTGTFDVWVRFASDYNAFSLNNIGVGTSDIELIEVRR